MDDRKGRREQDTGKHEPYQTCLHPSPSLFLMFLLCGLTCGLGTPGLSVEKSCSRTLARSMGWMIPVAKHALRPPHRKGCADRSDL